MLRPFLVIGSYSKTQRPEPADRRLRPGAAGPGPVFGQAPRSATHRRVPDRTPPNAASLRVHPEHFPFEMFRLYGTMISSASAERENK